MQPCDSKRVPEPIIAAPPLAGQGHFHLAHCGRPSKTLVILSFFRTAEGVAHSVPGFGRMVEVAIRANDGHAVKGDTVRREGPCWPRTLTLKRASLACPALEVDVGTEASVPAVIFLRNPAFQKNATKEMI